MIGVYKITNTSDGKVYVGSSVQIEKRWKEHRKKLHNGTHHSPHLLAAWRKYGEDSFSFDVLLVCEREDVLSYESRSIESLNTTNPKLGYNTCAIAGSRAGTKQSPEARENISKSLLASPLVQARRGVRLCDLAYTKAATLKKLHGIPIEVRAKMSASKKGVKKTDAHKEKLRVSNLGLKRSDETRQRISDSKAGKTVSRAIVEAKRSTKLTAAAVKEIRRLHADEFVTRADLAKQFSVSARNIGMILARETWQQE